LKVARKLNSFLVVALLGVVTLWGGCSSSRAPRTTAGVTAELRVTGNVTAVTWNLRGYPETRSADRRWFTRELDGLHPDVICVQEIANQAKVDTFQAKEKHSASVAFSDSSDGQDNAIFADDRVTLEDLPDPTGFQHPAQAAYVAYRGFDAVVVTVHLSWTNAALREQEKALLKDVVTEALQKDPDVIICGDFNTTEPGIEELAQAIGMQVMVPAGQEGIGTTWAGNRYDHFLISPDLASEEAVSCRIVTFSGGDLTTAKRVSDHLPVLAVFRADSVFRDRN
jgi:endonuclease/exonuclease/phosphatase family metal-dependent hydrolase